MTAELIFSSSIFFVAVKTESAGETIATLIEYGTISYHNFQIGSIVEIKASKKICVQIEYCACKFQARGITYFEFSEIMVDKAGLNIRSRSVSIKVLEPGQTEVNYCS